MVFFTRSFFSLQRFVSPVVQEAHDTVNPDESDTMMAVQHAEEFRNEDTNTHEDVTTIGQTT